MHRQKPIAIRLLELSSTTRVQLGGSPDSLTYGHANVASMVLKHAQELASTKDAKRIRALVCALNLLLVAIERPSSARELVGLANKLLR